METYADEAGVDDETYLAQSGVDTDEVQAAAERIDDSNGGQSKRATVEQALRELDDPDESAIIAYASDRGVSAEYTKTALAKLVRAGKATESDGRYRPL
jgi:fatty acid-binding protein DegV